MKFLKLAAVVTAGMVLASALTPQFVTFADAVDAPEEGVWEYLGTAMNLSKARDGELDNTPEEQKELYGVEESYFIFKDGKASRYDFGDSVREINTANYTKEYDFILIEYCNVFAGPITSAYDPVFEGDMLYLLEADYSDSVIEMIENQEDPASIEERKEFYQSNAYCTVFKRSEKQDLSPEVPSMEDLKDAIAENPDSMIGVWLATQCTYLGEEEEVVEFPEEGIDTWTNYSFIYDKEDLYLLEDDSYTRDYTIFPVASDDGATLTLAIGYDFTYVVSYEGDKPVLDITLFDSAVYHCELVEE